MSVEEGELWFVQSEGGCPVWTEKFDPGEYELDTTAGSHNYPNELFLYVFMSAMEQNQVPTPALVMACGTEFRIRRNSLSDDSSSGPLSLPVGSAADAGWYPPVPVSTVWEKANLFISCSSPNGDCGLLSLGPWARGWI
jgi:hypothetical protein